jgi:SMI1-KNR4 cell-wall
VSKQKDDLGEKIKMLHDNLNEMYALDSNWRTWGKWPDSVHGSILYDGASNDQIVEAEVRSGHKFPPSYKEFLQLHCAWEHFWGDSTLIGTGPPETRRAEEEIRENIAKQESDLREELGDNPSSEAIAAWESEDESNLYLANHLVIGTDFSGAHWVFDTRTRRSNGEMKLVFWDISYGAQDPTFAKFHEFLDWVTGEVAFRLEHLKSKPGRETEGK